MNLKLGLYTLSVLFSFNMLAQSVPSKLLVLKSIENGYESLSEDKELIETTDIKMSFPVEGEASDEKCVILLHADQKADAHKVSQNINSLIDNNSNKCALLDEIRLNKEKLVKDNKWNISFHFGFSRTFYRPTDMKLTSSRMDVLIKDFEFDERTSAGFYNPMNWEGAGDAFRWIDEPTNHFILTAEKNGHSIILSIFHPKFLKKQHQQKQVSGVIDGVEVDDVIEINEPFDGYNNEVGEMYLIRFENTHMQMAWQIGYGYEFKLFNSKKAGALSVRPSVLIGLMTGQHLTVYTQEGEYWEYDYFKQKDEIHGPMISAGLRVNYRIKNFNFFVDGKYSHARLKHGFMDGEAEYNLNYTPVTFGIGYSFDFDKKKKKKKKPKF